MNTVKVWKPSTPLPGVSALLVPWPSPNPPSRPQFEQALQNRLQQLIQQNHQQAQQVLSSSVEHNPDLYQIAQEVPPQHWPAAILACGQMQTLLDQIDPSQGESLELDPSELPSLEAISEALPQ